MPSLAQYQATRGRPSPVRLEDVNAGRLPSLYASRGQGLESQQLDLAQAGLSMRQREADLAASQGRTALVTSGLNTSIAGAGLLEAAYPGTLGGIGSKLSGLWGGGSAAATASGAAEASGLAATGAAAGVTEGTGVAAAYPLFGGASAAALPAAEGATAGLAAGGTAAGGVGSTASGVGAGVAAGGIGLSSLLGPAAAGFAGGMLGSRFLGPLLPFGRKGGTGQRVAGGAIGGAAAGAIAGSVVPVVGTLIGAAVGGAAGALGGLSIIATATYGLDSPETRLAQTYRRRKMGAMTYRGYLKWGAPIARLIEEQPDLRAEVRKVLVEPCLVAMSAELLELPSYMYMWERAYLRLWLDFSREVGRQEVRHGLCA